MAINEPLKKKLEQILKIQRGLQEQKEEVEKELMHAVGSEPKELGKKRKIAEKYLHLLQALEKLEEHGDRIVRQIGEE